MTTELAGLRVQITIEEDGTPDPPKLPKGTITRTITGPYNVSYQLVRLDHPVSSKRASTGGLWTLTDLLIAPSFTGDSLLRLQKSRNGEIVVNIVNLLRPLEPDDPLVDSKKGEYFARGIVKRA